MATLTRQAHYNAPRIFKQLHGDLAAHAQTVAASFGTALTEPWRHEF